MSEELEGLKAENLKLKQRVKRLEKRVKKLKTREETLAEEILELDAEVAANVPVYEINREGRCEKCGKKCDSLQLPVGILLTCGCGWRKIEDKSK